RHTRFSRDWSSDVCSSDLELLSSTRYEVNDGIIKALLSPDHLHEDITSGINVREMARRRFRDIAGIAGLVFQGYPGKAVKTRHLQANAGLFFSVFEDYSPTDLLLPDGQRAAFVF